MIAYIQAAEDLDPKFMALACIRLVERWTKTTVPPFAVVRETTLEIAGEIQSRGETRSRSQAETRALVQRRLAALNDPPSWRQRWNPNDEKTIQAHWEQFAEMLNLGPYAPPGGRAAEPVVECRIHDWIESFVRGACGVEPGHANEYDEGARALFEKAHQEGKLRTDALAESWGRDFARGLRLLARKRQARWLHGKDESRAPQPMAEVLSDALTELF